MGDWGSGRYDYVIRVALSQNQLHVVKTLRQDHSRQDGSNEKKNLITQNTWEDT